MEEVSRERDRAEGILARSVGRERIIRSSQGSNFALSATGERARRRSNTLARDFPHRPLQLSSVG